MKTRFLRLTVLLVLFAFIRPAGAIVFGQFDTFQDGTTNGWTNGGLATPVTNISSGGPAGAADAYAQVTADGSGAGSRLTTFNFTTWAGNYISAGVTTIEVDLLNQSAIPLSIRFAFMVDLVQGASGYLSAPMLLAVGSGWQHFSISITAANLIPVAGPGPYNTFFTNIGEMRIINEVGTSDLNGDRVTGQLGIDNLHAVPEPTVAALVAAGMLALAARFLGWRRRAIG